MSDRQLSPYELDQIKQELAFFLRNNPELEDDEPLRHDMFQGSTRLGEVLERLHDQHWSTMDLIAGAIDRRKKLDRRIDRLQYRAEREESMLLAILNICGLRKFEAGDFTFSLRKSPPRVAFLVNETDVEEWQRFLDRLEALKLVRIKRTPNRTAIAALLREGKTVPDCAFSNQPDTLSIRTT